ncbi:hypothetical protein VYU27_000872 [Nannochloropsis oceanica]
MTRRTSSTGSPQLDGPPQTHCRDHRRRASCAQCQHQRHPQQIHEPRAPPRNASDMYEQLLLGIIRPPRLGYEFPHALGPVTLSFSDGTVCHRTDFDVENGRNQKLGCSLWQPAGAETQDGWPCVIFLHGNSSSRVEAVKTNVLKSVMASGSALVGFDFTGCGNADGEYISLGWFEVHDTRQVIDELRRRGCGRIVLHGRSMGAVTALQYTIQACTVSSPPSHSSSSSSCSFSSASCYSSSSSMVIPAGLVLDSPFSGFKKLAYDLTSKGMVHIPHFATAAVLSLLRRSVRSRAGFDLFKLKPIKHVHHCTTVPALFLVAEDDELIPPWHAEGLRSKYGGPSLGIRFAGSHNSPRPAVVYALASVFVKAVNERESRFGSVAVDLALHLIETTAVVTSQKEEEEEEEEDREHGEEIMEDLKDDMYKGTHVSPRRHLQQHCQQQQQQQRRRRLRRQRYRGPYSYYYEHACSSSRGTQALRANHNDRAGRLKRIINKIETDGKQVSTRKGKMCEGGVAGGPHFIHAGSRPVGNIFLTSKRLIGALDVNLATRAVEEYLLEELVGVAVAIVQMQVQAVIKAEKQQQQQQQQRQQSQQGKDDAMLSASAPVPLLSKTLMLDVVAQTQRRLAERASWALPSSSASTSTSTSTSTSSTSTIKKEGTPFSLSEASGPSLTSWESVIYAEGQEQWNEIRRIVSCLKRLFLKDTQVVVQDSYSSILPAPAPAVAPPSPAAAAAKGTAIANPVMRPQMAWATSFGTKLCCFDTRDAYLSEGQEKGAGIARVAEAVLR